MSEEDKYYQPEIEEFCFGFEYEAKDPIAKEWVEFEVNLEFSSLWFASANKTRVKLLDREDLESLGWGYDKTYPGLNEDMFTTEEQILDYDYDSKYCRIYWRENNGDVTRFSGTIKNKSELKKVLKMIGV